MAARLQRRTGLPADEQIIDLALAELVDAGLITLDSPEPLATVTRRSLIRRFALSAAAVAMLPIVETILRPPQAHKVHFAVATLHSSRRAPHQRQYLSS